MSSFKQTKNHKVEKEEKKYGSFVGKKKKFIETITKEAQTLDLLDKYFKST